MSHEEQIEETHGIDNAGYGQISYTASSELVVVSEMKQAQTAVTKSQEKDGKCAKYCTLIGNLLTLSIVIAILALAVMIFLKLPNEPKSPNTTTCPTTACPKNTSEIFSKFPFGDPSLPWSKRVDDLVSRLTTDEVIDQLAKGGAGRFGGPAPAIGRLGIRPYQWSTECLRGAVKAGKATSYPQVIGLAAAFDRRLIFRMARATAIEVRAKHNDYSRRNVFRDGTGISCFAPNINIMRHPFWGRNQETYGEDPFLTGELATKFVEGLQGSGRYVLANAGCKHFAAHNGPENLPGTLIQIKPIFDAKVTDRDLWQTYLPAFQRCVEAGALSIMCSYNKLNGVPNCANKYLLTDILRKSFNFTGYVFSDGGAIELLDWAHKNFTSLQEAAVAAIKSGVNLEISLSEVYLTILSAAISNISVSEDSVAFSHLKQALEDGQVTEDLLRERVRPLFYTRMRLGEFDPQWMNPYNYLDLSVVQSREHQQLSLEAAVKSFVLLENKNGSLPIKKKVKKLALIGPFADESHGMELMYGDYSADREPSLEINLKDGLKVLGETLALSSGCVNILNIICVIDKPSIKQAATGADLVVLALGTGNHVETELFDRVNYNLPEEQNKILSVVREYTQAPVILLLFTGTPVDLQPLLAGENPPAAVMWMGFPAQTVGWAAAQVLSGAVSPAGRLPFTWYKSSKQLRSIYDYTMTSKTYRYFTESPHYPFGFGLSYAQFIYSSMRIASNVSVGETLLIEVDVKNIADDVAGDEVVQVYWKPSKPESGNPRLQLIGFQRVSFRAQEIKTVTILIKPAARMFWNGKTMSEIPGTYEVSVGGGPPDFTKTLTKQIKLS